MKAKNLKYIAYLFVISSFGLFYIAYLNESFILFLFGVGLIVFSILAIIFFMTIEMYQNDKKIDYEAAKKQNLSIVTCKQCNKENILEDQYCVYCGGKLEE